MFSVSPWCQKHKRSCIHKPIAVKCSYWACVSAPRSPHKTHDSAGRANRVDMHQTYHAVRNKLHANSIGGFVAAMRRQSDGKSANSMDHRRKRRKRQRRGLDASRFRQNRKNKNIVRFRMGLPRATRSAPKLRSPSFARNRPPTHRQTRNGRANHAFRLRGCLQRILESQCLQVHDIFKSHPHLANDACPQVLVRPWAHKDSQVRFCILDRNLNQRRTSVLKSVEEHIGAYRRQNALRCAERQTRSGGPQGEQSETCSSRRMDCNTRAISPAIAQMQDTTLMVD